MSLLPTNLKWIGPIATEKKGVTSIFDAQAQLTPLSVVRSGQYLNSSELLCMSSIPDRNIKSQDKVESSSFPC